MTRQPTPNLHNGPRTNEREPDKETGGVVTFIVPIATKSTLNLREHWASRARRVRAERKATRWAAICLPRGTLDWLITPLAVTLTRISPRRLDSGDNLNASMKAVRDEVATWLDIDDADPSVRWDYGQEKGKPAVRVRIEPVRVEVKP